MRRVSLGSLLLVVVGLHVHDAVAQSLRQALENARPSSAVAEDYGVQDSNYTFLSATDFRPLDSTTTYTIDEINNTTTALPLHRTGGTSVYFAHEINLPAGAILQSMTAYAFDFNAGSDVILDLCTASRDTNTGLNPAYGCTSATSTGIPGNTSIVFTYNSTLPVLAASKEYNYIILLGLPIADSSMSFNGVRLKWTRQVSPAPGTARYTDVPTTHAFFQYIEALAAAGITSGCSASPPQFCPDAPLTRGQMAVFLAKALGLHWTP